MGKPVLTVLLLLLAAPAVGQPPAREGNTWNWRHHEPNPARVRPAEERAGLITPKAARRQDRQVNDLAKTLLRQERQPPR